MKKEAKDIAIRTVKTMVETAIGFIGTAVLITDVNWETLISVIAMSGISAVLINMKKLLDEWQKKRKQAV